MNMQHRRCQTRAFPRRTQRFIFLAVLSIAVIDDFHRLSPSKFCASGLKLTSLGSKGGVLNVDTDTNTNGAESSHSHDNSEQSTRSSTTDRSTYGVDCSFPTHRNSINLNGNCPFDGVERQKNYDDFMEKCRESLHPLQYLCDESERSRIETNLIQPARIKNYTELGFQKVPTPPKLHEALTKFFWANAGQTATPEKWAPTTSDITSTTAMNHWKAYSRLMDIDDAYYNQSGEHLRTIVWDETRPVLEQWAGVELSPSALYGIRVWSNHAVVPPHLDAEPLVITAVINVAETLTNPWIMEMIGHDGRAYNVTLLPGEMLLYEGASVIHGRPFPMKGIFSSNVFVHFEPIGHYLNQPYFDPDGRSPEEDLEYLYQQALSRAKVAENLDDSLKAATIQSTLHPNYIESGSLHAKRWRQTHQRAKLRITLDSAALNVHTAASSGDLEALILLEEASPGSIQKVDENGWTPLHEAIRSDQLAVIKFLLSKGLNINQRTHNGEGGSPLWWAKQYHGKDHRIVKFLQSKGAKEIPPEKEK
ncbi:hypothetical protein HJC23_001229 [Cyclotella cryptica]|uniref:Uncharacterized protein n=1 Tax=Cyclotella cryptica TaxID=29204 RepID=A0ABD3QNI0_9STRA|eukprot:CCRYP_003899-RA/>CCRYP_003899-RA protein AED:0.12 eAED:0.12 QI:21/1/1/1/0.75/0.6/5/2096/533